MTQLDYSSVVSALPSIGALPSSANIWYDTITSTTYSNVVDIDLSSSLYELKFRYNEEKFTLEEIVESLKEIYPERFI